MEIKSILKFTLILIFILVLYFIFILNIDYITISYDGKLEEYNNVYYKEAQEVSILYQLRELSAEYGEEIPDEAVEIMKESKIIRRILSNEKGIPEEGINKYIDYLKTEKIISFIKSNIVYINEEDYELAFSIDMNNIIYRVLDSKSEVILDNREITIENKYEIYEKTSRELQKLGITEEFNFEPETLYFKYAILKEVEKDIYGIEDNKNHIKVVVERPNYDIESLQIGFTEPLI